MLLQDLAQILVFRSRWAAPSTVIVMTPGNIAVTKPAKSEKYKPQPRNEQIIILNAVKQDGIGRMIRIIKNRHSMSNGIRHTFLGHIPTIK